EELGDALRGLRDAQADRRPEDVQRARRRIVEIAAAESSLALHTRITTARPFVERLVAFWSNHLCVSASAKLLVAPLAGAYEREAIRPHVLGRFEDMVLASAQHPAMLLYLDNAQSIGPASRPARLGARRGVQRGLNENYARELLELHTLGVDGGYSQQDVQELARILTGWTIAGLSFGGAARRRPGAAADGPVRFAFQPLLHEPGAKSVLGVRYEEAGVEEGERAIRMLARHPSTARFVATKLVRHFVADEPPAAAVDTLARVFRQTGGDLAEVTRALVALPDAWQPSRRKFRTPQDWLIAVLRAFHAGDASTALLPVLRQLRQPLWAPPSPKGYGDLTQEWADPDALMNRAELARTIGRRLRELNADPALLLDVIDVAPSDPLRAMLADTAIPREERLALAVAGPAFQWR
ncbi:MAG: DUF1800 domain-containing protein, partial [Longimicrobiales bacterium]